MGISQDGTFPPVVISVYFPNTSAPPAPRSMKLPRFGPQKLQFTTETSTPTPAKLSSAPGSPHNSGGMSLRLFLALPRLESTFN